MPAIYTQSKHTITAARGGTSVIQLSCQLVQVVQYLIEAHAVKYHTTGRWGAELPLNIHRFS